MFAKSSLLAFIPAALALLAGALVPLQASSNAALGRELGHPLWAALVSLLVSTAALLVAIALLRLGAPSLGSALRGPWWLWIGGLAGAFYVTMAAFLPPKLGALSFMLFVMTGQAVAAMVIDHFGLLGLPPRPSNLMRVAGMLIILCGLLVVQLGASKACTPSQETSPATARVSN